jgi:hypothetical protein
MAETDGQLVIGIELDDGTIKKVQADASALAKAIGGDLSGIVGKGIDKSFTGIATQLTFVANVASKAFGAVADVVGKAVHEASSAEAAMSRFNNVLANTGQYTAAASADFAEFAKSLQNVGTVSDDAVIEASTALISIGGLTGDALKKATQAAVDLSAGLGKDLGTSFDLVAKAAAGNTGALARYGIKIDESIPKSQQFAATLELLNQKFGGLDVSKANTFEGAMTKLSNSVNDAYEAVGGLVTGSAPLVAIIAKISEIVARVTKSFEGLKGQSVFDSMIKGAIDFATTLTSMVLPPIEVLYNAGTVVVNVFKSGFQQVIVLLATVADGFSLIGNSLGLVSDEQLAAVQAFKTGSEQILAGFTTDTQAAISNVFSTTVSDTIIPVLEEINAAAQTADPLAPMVANTTNAAAAINTEVAALTKKIDDMVKNGVVKSISTGIQTMVSNIAKGKNAFAGVLGAIGGIMGDMAISIGETLVLAGLGMEALQKSIVGMTGGPALFAGIALIALGSLLKSLTGGGGASAPAGGGGGGSSGVASIDAGAQPDPAAVSKNQQTQVAINIQGNILDRRESGLEIASVIQEFFDTNDGVLARA